MPIHIDEVEWESVKHPDAVSREDWGDFGGELTHAAWSGAEGDKPGPRQLLPFERPCMEWQADETCIECYDGQKKCFTDGNNHFIAPKGKGASHMYAGCVSEFCDPFCILTQKDVDRHKKWCIMVNERRMERGLPMLSWRPIDHLVTKLDSQGLPVLDKGKSVRTPFLRELEIGKNKEGYWNTALQGESRECSEEMAIIRNIKFPWVMHYEKQDASSGHHGCAKDALVATRLNRNHSGKQAFLRDTIVHISDLGPEHKLEAVTGSTTQFKQSFTFASGELEGKQKGAEVVLLERGKLKPGMLLSHKTNKELCMQTVLSKCSDFAAKKPLLQKVLEKHGQMVHWLPKYHAPCNASEYFWGNGKQRF